MNPYYFRAEIRSRGNTYFTKLCVSSVVINGFGVYQYITGLYLLT